MSEDRTVHGRTPGGLEVVRYARSGKWYIEPFGGGRRWLCTTYEAAQIAAQQGRAFLGLPGGQGFDAAVRRFWAETSAAGRN